MSDILTPTEYAALPEQRRNAYPCTLTVRYYDNTGARPVVVVAKYHVGGVVPESGLIAKWKGERSGRNWQFIKILPH